MKIFFFLILFLSAPLYADYNGSLFDPVTGDLLRVRVYLPLNQICVQINSANHICWSSIISNDLLLEDGNFFLLQDSGKLILE